MPILSLMKRFCKGRPCPHSNTNIRVRIGKILSSLSKPRNVPFGSSPSHALSIPANVTHGASYISHALASIISGTPHGFCAADTHPSVPSGFSYHFFYRFWVYPHATFSFVLVISVVQIFYLADMAYYRFLEIDFQGQFSRDVWHDVFRRPFCAFPAFAQNQAVVHISHVFMTSANFSWQTLFRSGECSITLAFSCTFPTAGRVRDFHPLEHALFWLS